MGQTVSRIDSRHVGIYKKLLAIQNHNTRLQTIDTLLQDGGVVNSAKVAGIYGAILQYCAAIRHGQAPPLLPYEQGVAQTQAPQQTHTPVVYHGQPQEELANRFVSNQRSYHPQQFQQRLPSAQMTGGGGNQLVAVGQVKHQDYFQQVSKPRQSEKALNFFTACLRVLGIQEEVSLTEEMLKSAYKKAARSSHPDKGGSKEAFDAVTRAFAYLMDIIKLVKGASGSAGQDTVPTLDTANQRRRDAAESWKMPDEPVKLNPKNLDMNKFNQLFEQTRVPDPDEDGYGDWLKDGEGGKKSRKIKGAKNFSEDFNREVFNRIFEEEQEAEGRGGGALIQFNHPQELTLSAHSGVELGRDRPPDYTAAYDSKMQFTDLMSAYTKENTVSEKVRNVKVENRDFNSYKAQREKAPERYNEAEMSALASYESQQKRREQQRQLRAAQEQVQAQDYFARMKQLVITEK